MLNYSNPFSCSVNATKSELILTFRQIHPDIGADGVNKGNKEELISELVMNLEMATALKDALETTLSSGPLAD